MGKSGSGGGIDLFRGVEIGTSKKQTSISTQETYAPQITTTKTYDYSPVIQIDSPYASATSKKEQAISTTPTQTIAPVLMPTQLQGAGQVGTPATASGGGAGINIWDMVIVGGLGLGAYFLLIKKEDKK